MHYPHVNLIWTNWVISLRTWALGYGGMGCSATDSVQERPCSTINIPPKGIITSAINVQSTWIQIIAISRNTVEGKQNPGCRSRVPGICSVVHAAFSLIRARVFVLAHHACLARRRVLDMWLHFRSWTGRYLQFPGSFIKNYLDIQAMAFRLVLGRWCVASSFIG